MNTLILNPGTLEPPNLKDLQDVRLGSYLLFVLSRPLHFDALLQGLHEMIRQLAYFTHASTRDLCDSHRVGRDRSARLFSLWDMP